MQTKHLLISGANGYIASFLIKNIRELNYHVDSASRSHDSSLYLDFSNPKQVADTRISGIDTMIHTVSPNESLYQTDVYRGVSENASGIHAALDFCVHNEIQNFIYISSFHVFGNQTGHLDENTPALPCNDYGLAHYIAEQTVQMYDRQKKLNAWIIRPSNLFGVPEHPDTFQRWNLIPFAFCKEAVRQRSITLRSSGSQFRNFVGLNDVTDKIVWLLEHAPVQRLIHAYGKETIRVYDYALRVQSISSNILGEPVKLICPSESLKAPYFEFTSTQRYPEILPKDDLDTFIEDMVQVLLKKQI